MRLALVALAACYTGTVAPQPAKRAPEVAPIAIHASAKGAIQLVAAAPLSDGGLVVVAGAHPPCDYPSRAVEVARFDATGKLVWTRCVPAGSEVVAAASDAGTWLATTVDPNVAPNVDGDNRDLVVARFITPAGNVGEPRAVVRFHDASQRPESAGASARNSVENLRLTSAAIANGELVIAGATKEGAIVDGVWQTEAVGISMQGVVLAVPRSGPVRVVAASAGALFQDVAVANGRYVAAGWCSRSSNTHAPELFHCPDALTAFAITGELAGTPRVHVIGEEVYDARVAIDGDGTIVVAAAGWRSPVVVEGITVTGKCARFALVTLWTRAGVLRYARGLGDCTQPQASPFARDGQASSLADDNISEHLADIAHVAIVDHQAVVTVRVEETNHLPWPVRFDAIALGVPFGHAAAVLTLDDRGHVVADRLLRVDGRPSGIDQPDTSLAPNAGVTRVVVARAAARGWLVVEHAGSITIDRKPFPLGGTLPEPDEDMFHRNTLQCDVATLRSHPDIAAMIREVADGGGEPDDFACRRRVVAEVGIDIVPF